MRQLRIVDASRLAVLCVLAVLCAVSTPVYAAFGESFRSVPITAILFTFVLSTLAGVVALLNRIRDELRANGSLRYPWIFVTSHMTGSWLAGALVFIIGLGNEWPDWTVAGAIIGASFLGAVFIERAAIRWISQKMGIDITKPSPLDPPVQRKFEVTQPEAYVPARRRRNELPPLPPPRPRTRREESPSDFTPFDESG